MENSENTSNNHLFATGLNTSNDDMKLDNNDIVDDQDIEHDLGDYRINK